MELGKVLAANIRQYKLDHALSIVELAEELHLAVSTTQEYLNGNGNPRGDTLELLAQRMGIPVAQLVSPPAGTLERVPERPPQQPQVRHMVRAARDLAALPPDKREQGLRLLQELTDLFAGA